MKKQFREMLKLCTKDNNFYFEDKLYKQINGVPIGGCPSLAFVFLSYYEEKW